MPDNYFNKTAELLFSRFKDDHRAWAEAVIEELKRRFPEADHWTTGGQEFKFIDIRIGKKTLGKKSGWPVFYIQQRPSYTGSVCFIANKYALASGEYASIDIDSAPELTDVRAFLDGLEFSEDGANRLSGSGRQPADYPVTDSTGEEQAPDSEELLPVQNMTPRAPQALNRILYGPPGTGKTYRTTREALSIIEGTQAPAGDFAAQKRRFDALRREGRIAFVTFHQSFSYEDFIEGIRAETEAGQLSYRVRDGIFKRMAITAMYSRPTGLATGREPDFDVVHDKFMEQVANSLPYPVTSSTGNHLEIVGVNSKGTFQVTHAGRELRHGVSRDRLKALYQAYPNLAALKLRTTVDAISSVIGGANSTVYWAVLSSLLTIKEEIKAEQKDEGNDVVSIDEPIEYEQMKRRVLGGDALAPNGKPYVLIIDEINRGNMSRIFGELITLIETSKRAGGSETAEVQLPYSNEPFSVPDNLYLIGTMNTADRSLAVVDTALRRRFDFIEMMPDLKALKEKNVPGVNVARMLETINLRIEHLYDREHTIGHAFFMGLSDNAGIADLARIFRNNVLPLLEEYFYEDWEKIDKVLGNCGIYEKQQSARLGFAHKASTWRRQEDRLMLADTYRRIYLPAEALQDAAMAAPAPAEHDD